MTGHARFLGAVDELRIFTRVLSDAQVLALYQYQPPAQTAYQPLAETHNPLAFKLSQNYPNPFNPTTRIDYTLPLDAHVSLKVYDILGREVLMLVDEFQSAGNKSVGLNAASLPSGVYFYRLQAGNLTAVNKMMLLK